MAYIFLKNNDMKLLDKVIDFLQIAKMFICLVVLQCIFIFEKNNYYEITQ